MPRRDTREKKLQREADLAAWERRRRESEEFLLEFRRDVVNFYDLHKGCPRKGCRRARTCMSPTVACHDVVEDMLKEHFYPKLQAYLSKSAH